MKKLTEGYSRFRDEVFPRRAQQFRQLAGGQAPHTMVITCSDSRVVPELILDSGPGELFVVRNAGNIVPTYTPDGEAVSAAVDYAVSALGVDRIVVLGHSGCGAMHAVADPQKVAALPAVAAWIRHAEGARRLVERNYPHCQGEDAVAALIDENVLAQLDHLRTHPAVAARLASGELTIHGWVFDIGAATVRVYDAKSARWVAMAGLTPDQFPDASPQPRLAPPAKGGPSV